MERTKRTSRGCRTTMRQHLHQVGAFKRMRLGWQARVFMSVQQASRRMHTHGYVICRRQSDKHPACIKPTFSFSLVEMGDGHCLTPDMSEAEVSVPSVLTAVKPLREPLTLLRDTCDGIHPAPLDLGLFVERSKEPVADKLQVPVLKGRGKVALDGSSVYQLHDYQQKMIDSLRAEYSTPAGKTLVVNIDALQDRINSAVSAQLSKDTLVCDTEVRRRQAAERIRFLKLLGWQTMDTAPKNQPVLAWCIDDCGEELSKDGCLSLYRAHADGSSCVEDGPHVVEWGGGYVDDCFDSPGGIVMPDWWFQSGSCFEIAANPIVWYPVAGLELMAEP